jgi:anti-sigma factor RsiW
VVKGDVDPRRLQQTGGQWANSHTWTARGVRLVLIGDMPVEELRRLAQQVTG